MSKGLIKESFIFSGDLLSDFVSLGFEHTALQGFADEELRRKDIVWIVISYNVLIDRLPAAGETGTAVTRNGRVRRKFGFFPRYFELYDAEGKQLVRAASLFSLMDMKTRAFADTEKLGIDFEDQTKEDDLPFNRHFPQIEADTESLLVIGPDRIDVNGHMNNRQYVRLALDELGLKMEDVRSFYIRYENEALLGDALHLARGSEGRTHLIAGSCGDRKIFRMTAETF